MCVCVSPNPISMTNKFLYLLLFCAFAKCAFAQSYQNEWIDYNKTYYKFKVGPFGYDVVGAPVKNGVVRITQPALAAAGLANIPAEQFQLWKDGQEVTLYISKSSGILSPCDYIEFWGEIANGKADKQLYSDSSFQLSDYWSLESDSAAYFLTVNSGGNNKRFITVANNASATNLSPEKNFIYTVGRYYRTEINQGYHVHYDEDLYLSAYSSGEGFSSRAVRKNGSTYGQGELPQTFPKLYLDTTAVSMTARFNMVGNASYSRDVKILLNNNDLTQFSLGYYLSVKQIIPGIPVTRIKNDTASFVIQNLSGVNADELRVASIELDYPRLFNFGGATSFEFYIDSSAAGRYLKIANFNNSKDDAVLYDITNGKKYIGDANIKDTLQFLLQPSTEKYHLILVRGDGSTATIINTIQQRPFTNFTQQANQGNYLIISNPLLSDGSSNYIQEYKDYRSSDSGGHFNVKIIDIHDLEDQFAYGINMHPLAIKNFLCFARHNFSTPPDYAFLIGKGVAYTAYRFSETNPLTSQLNLIPVFGSPGSDNLLSSENYSDAPETPIGRLSAVTPEEVHVYLDKIKEYESAQRNVYNSISEKLWMKKALHLAGQNDASITYLVDSFQRDYTEIISDTLLGADVSTYSKTNDAANYAESLTDFTDQFNNGSGLVEYLGHASSTSIDFNLDDPKNYNNKGKYPVFIVNGCLAGNIFDYDVNRLNNRSTLSEKFVLEPDRGSIGYLSSSSYAVLTYINLFTQQFYIAMTSKEYGRGFGDVIKDGITNVLNYTGTTDFYSRMHAEQFTFNGDPALKINTSPLPDLAVDSSQISITPGYITAATDSFTAKIKMFNLGKATNDSVHFYLVQKFPNGTIDTVFSKNIHAIKNIDSIELKLPVISNQGEGATILTAMIDDNRKIAEVTEENNIASLKVKISKDDPLPVYPYNYSIVNKNTVDLSASAPFNSTAQYIVELDTTALFNSAFKISRQQISNGGLITFDNISLPFTNTVYYWRVAKDSVNNHWNSFSFIYRNDGSTGFEQAHFYQHTQSSFDGIVADTSVRDFKFSPAYSNLFIQHSIYPTSGTQDAQFSVSLNGSFVAWSACVGSSIMFNVFDPNTLKPVLDSTKPYNAGSTTCKGLMSRYNFEYSTQSASTRKNAMDFLDNFVPNGYYVVARKVYDMGNVDWAPTVWAKDTTLYGHNNSLYHRLKAQGVAIDSFIYPRTFAFIFKKNDSAHFEPVSVLSKGLYDRIVTSQNIQGFDSTGTVTSPVFGPAKTWSKVIWNGEAENNNEIATLDVISVDKAGKDSVWFTINSSQHELDISAINAQNYPYLKLRMHTKDGVTTLPYQLQNWRAEYVPAPEGAIAANLGINIPSTIKFNHDVHIAYDTLKGDVVFKNISASSFDSLKIKLVLYDAYNTPYTFSLPKMRPLPGGDTLHVAFAVNASSLQEGAYSLYLEVNPNNDQLEQYHYNNFIYRPLYIDRGIMLPVHLLGFTAKLVNNNTLLQWNVSDELNVDNYTIEFSKDGQTFNTIGNVAATNMKAQPKSYSFIHTSPVSGNNYYRLKIIDKDGKYTWSSVRIVTVNANSVKVFPNPFHDQLNIASNGTATVTLYDVEGRLLLKQALTGNATLHIHDLAKGMYMVKVTEGSNTHSYKVYKD